MKRNILIIVGGIILIAVGIYFAIGAKKDSTLGSTNKVGEQIAQNSRGYSVKVTSDTNNIKSKQVTKITYKIVRDGQEVLKDFTVAHEKIMHFILIRKDLQNFQHLHPEFNQQTGEFSINVTFPDDGPYRLYPDFTPTPDNPEKVPVTLSFDLNVGDPDKYIPQPLTPEVDTNKTLGGLTIDYFFGMTPRAEAQLDYALTVSDPKTNEQVLLEPYLGDMGHSVIIKADSLEFIHTHAAGVYMDEMEGMSASEHAGHQSEPDTINFATTFSQPGVYKIFTQFKYREEVFTSDYTISVN